MSNKPLKILSVCTSDTSGGAARAAKRIHDGINSLNIGVKSEMFVKYKHSSDPFVHSIDEFTPNNIVFKVSDYIASKVKNKVQHYRWNKYPDRERIFMSDMRGTSIYGALQKLDYDVLHLHWLNQRFIKLEDLIGLNKPIVWTLHDSWPFCGVCHYFFECEEYKNQCGKCPLLHSDDIKDLSHIVWNEKSEIYKQLNLHIVTPSKWLGDCARQSSLLGQFPVTVIPNCLDTNVFRPIFSDKFSPKWRNFLEKKVSKPFVLYGAMNAATDKIKGLKNLLSALKILEEQNNADFELIVFGANKSDLSFDLNIPIHYVGTITDTHYLVELYNLADVMVVPSLTENLSCTIMESLSCATPVCCFNIGGNSDMVMHKENGYLAVEDDDIDLANGIDWCLKNNNNNTLGMCGREWVLKNYSVGIVAELYAQQYYHVTMF